MSRWGAGMQLGPYELLTPIGEGGMGEVWKARDPRLHRVVAIKRLKGQYSERFRQEARAIAALNHPHICQVYDVGPDYLVLEYIEGQQLTGPLLSDEAVRLAIDIAGAIEAAHRKGVSSPADRNAGLAKLMAATDLDDTLTVEGTVIGTAAYMSPEQAEGKAVDERSDVFSFGAVFYEMLAGSRTFPGRSRAQVLSAVLHDDPPPFEAPAAFERIVRRCLAKQPAQRFQSMGEVRMALEQMSVKSVESQPSIAVLPFSTLSTDKENEYFSDGLTEEIINALAQIPGLNVTARTSSFAFRGKEQDIRKIAETLGVRTILEGSVRRAASRIRVTAQLIDATDGYHRWSERYDREMVDVFAIRDEIAQAIAVALKVKLAMNPPARRHTPSVPAYESFLKARYFLRKATPESLSRGREFLEEAIALDPEFALAQAELAMYFVQMAAWHLLEARKALPQAREAAQKALEIDPSLPEAHAGLAVVSVFLDHDWEEAGREFALAMASDPVPPSVSHFYGFYYLIPLGRSREAIEKLERALREDPLNVQCRTQLGVCYWAAGRHEDAGRQFRQALDLDENFWLALLVHGIWQLQNGIIQEALVFAGRAYSVAPKNAACIGLLAAVLSRTGDSERSSELLRKLGDAEAFGAPLGLLTFHCAKLEMDKAADWAARAIEQRDLNSLPAVCGPNRRLFLSSGRWPALARMLNLPETVPGQSP